MTGPVVCVHPGCKKLAVWVLVRARTAMVEGVAYPQCSAHAASSLTLDPSLTLVPKVAA